MSDIRNRIAAGLEQAFAARGFAEPSVEDLRAAAGVSLRTLYKYVPSRADMVLAALEHRHARYLGLLFDSLPTDPAAALDHLFDRIGIWMESEAAHGCLFHGAVAADPGNVALRDLLARHKSEVAERAARATDLAGREVGLLLVIEGLTQAWALHRHDALTGARRLARGLASSVH